MLHSACLHAITSNVVQNLLTLIGIAQVKTCTDEDKVGNHDCIFKRLRANRSKT